MTKSYTTLSETNHYVTLTGKIGASSENAGIGPSIMTITVVQATNDETGQAYAATYSVAYDGHHQFGGPAALLIDGMAPGGHDQRIWHCQIHTAHLHCNAQAIVHAAEPCTLTIPFFHGFDRHDLCTVCSCRVIDHQRSRTPSLFDSEGNQLR